MSDFLNDYELYHHGIIGQKWGIRRYQYQDGSLTAEGRQRYSRGDVHRIKREFKKEAYKKNRSEGQGVIKSYMNAGKEAVQKTINVVGKQRYNQVAKQDAAILAGATAAVDVLTAAAITAGISRMGNSEWNDNWYSFNSRYHYSRYL